MKSSRNYPVYTVNKHAEGLLVGGHPWVYENDILHSPENEPENGTLADVVSTKGCLSWHRFSLTEKQDPGAAHLPQRQRHLRCRFLEAPCRIRLGLPQNCAGARRPDRLPCHFWRS